MNVSAFHLALALNLTATCHQTAMQTKTKLLPYKFNQRQLLDGKGLLSSELAESYFFLWQLTRDTKYRNYAWQLAQAIFRHCRLDNGEYFSIENVNVIPTTKTNLHSPNFLSSTLKYLYLTFTDDTDVFPFNQWFFNSYGHPLPSIDTNSAVLPQIEETVEMKQHFIRLMAREAWNAYRQYAWGSGAVQPISKKPNHSWFGANSGATLVAAMSTLHVMGLKEEWQQGKKWIEQTFDFNNIDFDIKVDAIIAQYIGGLLSCYSLSGDAIFRDKAIAIANRIKPAFNSTTGLPYYKFNPKQQTVNGSNNLIANIGHRQPEFIFLSALTNNSFWKDKLKQTSKYMQTLKRSDGLYMSKVNVETGKAKAVYWLDFDTIPFYYNLVKSYIQSDGGDVEAMKLYAEALDSLFQIGIIQTMPDGAVYTRIYDSYTYYDYSSSYVCQLGAMFSLGSSILSKLKLPNVDQKIAALHLELALKFTETCHRTADQTKTKLLPYKFSSTKILDTKFELRQTLAESYFILWKLTHNSKYRHYAWQMVQGIHRHCRTPSGGYSSIGKDVNQIPAGLIDYQPAFFLSYTLKFLYLTFTDDDSVLSLDRWFFNQIGHPLPICGKSQYYEAKDCNV